MEKMTKTMWYAVLKEIVEKSDYEDKAGAVEFIDKQVELIESKAAKAKAKKAEKRAEGDELRAAVESVLTSEYQTIDEIVAQVEGEEVTKAKVTARLTQLVAAGIAIKEAQKVEGRKVMAYALASSESVEE